MARHGQARGILHSWFPAGCTTRFAPSPTGHLHVGHVVNAIYVWGIARSLGGRVVLRLEDHDRQRCRPEFAVSILDDLDWLGLEADAPTTTSLRAESSDYRQSDCAAAYAGALARLRSTHHVFACDCSRRAIAASSPTGGPTDEARYPGRCASRGLTEAPGLGLRVALAPGTESFEDALLGRQTQDPYAQCGALLLRDRLDQWTYHFAVVVDDLRHQVDLVIRGADLLASTGRQIRLMRALGATDVPRYLHHPLIYRDDGLKLSKANGDAGVRELRAAGWRPDDVLGLAAAGCGLIERRRPLRVEDLPALFGE